MTKLNVKNNQWLKRNISGSLAEVTLAKRLWQQNCKAGNFVGLNFLYQALKAYFRGIFFVIRPEHIIVAYYRGLIFRFGALRNENNENKSQRKFPAIYGIQWNLL